ncbi:tetratricopeptide repeat-containing sensor histidine kinase [Polaribacter sp. Hel_I_88]|uniref:tetratricopeptide repeat-containing sensor histidine kinase n=1 Tax=Polaribacter sp. Hel_I_88 TaxID=1250006 RepID=UPI000B27ED7A|nr:tetratricopeptide repeat-containing sensor histidine kinase [Polaribacter sp. Hel_I_88]
MKKIILLLFICCNFYNLFSLENKKTTEEVYLSKTSSVISILNDSLFKISYDKVLSIYKKGQYGQALEGALILLDNSKKNKNLYWSYKLSYLIGDIYNKTNKYEKSLEYFKKSYQKSKLNTFDNFDKQFNNVDYANSIFKLGSTYHKLFVSINVSDKLTYLDSIKLHNKKYAYLDSAKVYYEKIENLSLLNSEIESLKTITFTNLSAIYEQDSSFVKAEIYVRKALSIHKKNNNNLSAANSLNNLGNIFLSQGEYQKSKEVYNQALVLIKNDDNPRAIITKASLYSNLAWAMRNLKEYEAYDFQEKSYEIEGNIRQREVDKAVEEITEKYNFDVKKQVLLQEQENKRLKDQRVFLIIGIIALIIILSLAYKIKVKTLKQNNLALELTQVELLQNQKIEKIKSEAQIRILNATLDGKESERKQIAETLHDSVSALLSSATLHLQATRKQFNGSTPVEIDKTQEIILEASHKIRDLSHTLVSSVLLKFGLNFAIKDIAEKYSNSVLKIETNIKKVRRYEQGFEIKVYNITQEFANNILKHSNATNALIALKEKNEALYITISDDGVGFDKNSINIKDGLGINQIDARIQMMKGEFNIESSLNEGTKITVILPIVEKEAFSHV